MPFHISMEYSGPNITDLVFNRGHPSHTHSCSPAWAVIPALGSKMDGLGAYLMGGRAFGGQHQFRVPTALLSHSQSILGTKGKASWGLLQFQLPEPLGRSHGVAQIHCNPPLVRSETGRWCERPSPTCTPPQTPGQDNKDLPAHVRHYSLLKSVTEASGPREFGCFCGWVRLGGAWSLCLWLSGQYCVSPTPRQQQHFCAGGGSCASFSAQS